MKKRAEDRLSFSLKDPANGGYSASRIASLWMVLIDTVWLWACIKGLPPTEAYVPVSSFLGTCTMVAFGAYGFNSFANGWKHNVGEIASSVFSKTTVLSQTNQPESVVAPPEKKES